eukprot:NODE_4820_length_1842_cov_3.869388.p1 GENE.NODE_4820_length_1842_cov_3.869388~~NODE_4820_length_1842_cov_3.869388.p1  ORF type:complete len:547 (+),score=198.92 NODE_4820_length_1842_cov_3.869388:249-1643(+)
MRSGDFRALDPLAAFLELDKDALRKSFEHFRPSNKDAAMEMPPESLRAIRALEERRAPGWFPARFPEQQLQLGSCRRAPSSSRPMEAASRGSAIAAPQEEEEEEDEVLFNQKLVLLVSSMNEEQLSAWDNVQQSACSINPTDQFNAQQKLYDVLTDDQKFLLERAQLNEQLVEVYSNTELDPSRYVCLHFHLGTCGFGSEVNNLLSAAVYCEQNNLACVIEDDQWNAGRLHDYFACKPVVHRRCPRGGACRMLEVKRSMRVATPGWFAVCKHAMSVSVTTKAELSQRFWRYTAETERYIADLNRELSLPSKYVAVQIRRGDKVYSPQGNRGFEALPIETSAYIEAALACLDEASCNTLVVCSDDLLGVEDFSTAIRKARRGIAVRWRECGGAPPALRCGHWQKSWNALPLEERHVLTCEFLADVEVMRNAHSLVCTLSSNVGRLVTLLRGNERVLSLDEEWTNS